MKPLSLLAFISLAMLWGGSFLFMRISAAEFGPIASIELRVLLAALALLPFILKNKYRSLYLSNWKSLSIVGITNAALPFCMLSYGTLHLSSGFTAILNAAVPFFTAIFGYWIWQERLSASRVTGLVIGFAGVAALVWSRGHMTLQGEWLGILACLVASTSYGIAANYTRHYTAHLPPIVVTAGSLWAASIALMPLAWTYWPTSTPSLRAWTAVSLLALACTALGFILFFHLIATIGAGKTVMVTFLIPVFASLWGALILDEKVSSGMVVGGAIVLAGVALATGMVSFNRTPSQPLAGTPGKSRQST